jgi:hypothetical protein
VHYDPARKAELDALCAAAGPWMRTAVDGLTVTVRPSPERRPATEPTSTGASA